MKPNFALTLSFDGIGLLHRVPGGWHMVGDVPLDAPDLAAELAVLRRTAVQLDAAGLRSKLVIPNEQIRYLRLPAPAKGVDMATHVARALDGTTPYDVADLRFDWIVVGDDLHVAAVARETLDEAEDFAEEHEFCPVSFVAIPDSDSFPGEPYFGPTMAAARLIDPGDRLLRDTHAIRVLGRSETPPLAPPAVADAAETAEPAAAETATEAPAAQPQAAAEPAPSDKTGTADTPVAANLPVAEDSPLATDTPQPEEQPAPDTAVADTDADTGTVTGTDTDADKGIDKDADTGTVTSTEAETAAEDALDATPPPAFTTRRLQTRPAPEDAVPPDTTTTAVADRGDTTADTTPAAAPDAPVQPEAAPAPRKPIIAELPPLPKAAPPRPLQSASAEGSPPALTGASAKTPTETPANRPRKAAPLPDPALRPAAFRSAAPLPPAARPGVAQRLSRPISRLTARLKTPRAKASSPDTIAEAAQPRATRPDLSEKQRLTIFGARRTEAEGSAPRNKPRYMAVIMTGALLVLMAVVAAWSSLFSGDDAGGTALPRDLAGADAPATAPLTSAPTAAIQPAPDSSAATPEVDLARVQDAPNLRDLDADMPLAPQDTPEQAAAQTPEQMAAAALSSYAATGIWQIAPDQPGAPPSTTLDDLYLASIDTRLQNFDAIALPEARSLTDQRPAAQPNPAPPGTTFDLDARGLVIATPEGAPTPEGAVVFTGRPAVTPPGMPTRFDRTPGTTEAESAADSDQPRIRPRPRPDTLIETNERAQLGGLSRAELGERRPRLRPATLAAVALALREAEATPAAEAEADPDAEAAEDEAEARANATEQAIASSLKPLARPRNFASTVESTREALQPAPQPVATAALSAPRSAAPQIPSSASVAQQATVRGAINLRQVNLIGVYGQPSNRRALVRLSNGRYQKVQVGDRLDGGQVRAIGENELSYVKGNRSFVLTMPQG